jgi:hypothetical protein
MFGKILHSLGLQMAAKGLKLPPIAGNQCEPKHKKAD